MKPILIFAVCISLFQTYTVKTQAFPSSVKVKNVDGKYRLYVNDKEFYVMGAGCEFGNIELLGKSGANSFRTWRTENGKSSGKEILDKAQQCGLMVLMGLAMKPVRSGFDYTDSLAVSFQFEAIKTQVLKYKDHPALLGWAAGNELSISGKKPEVWDAVNDIAKYIHSVDPNHPVTTTLAGINKDVVTEIKKRCTDLDFLSIQTYGDIINLQKRIKDADWDGPYMVTEWGATGHWEVARTEWRAPIEQTSSEKAAAFIERFNKGIKADSLNCLGSYVFLWGQKQERTPTWYGMFTENGDAIETVDVMQWIWSGKWPANRCPHLDSVKLNGKNACQNLYVKPEDKLEGIIIASDPDGDKLKYIYELMPESTNLKSGGDRESKPEVLLHIESDKNTFEMKAPLKEGPYRLFFYALDGKKHGCTANIPFYVKKE